MSMYQIPLFNAVSLRWVAGVELDGKAYRFQFDYNTREDSFYLSILNNSNSLILSGIKLVPGYQLLTQYHAITDVPPGDLFLYDVQQDLSTGHPGKDALGSRYLLAYTAAGV